MVGVRTHKICNVCNIEKPLNREYFMGESELKGFNPTCRECHTKKKLEKYWKDGNLLCLGCNKYLPEDSFRKHICMSKYRNGKEGKCHDCRSKDAKNRRVSRKTSSDQLFTERFLAVKQRSKVKNWDVYFDVSFLKELYKRQGYKCAISGIEMTADFANGKVFTNLSVDRIDSSQPYTKENTHLVCSIVNIMKHNLSTEELVFICRNIVNTADKNYNLSSDLQGVASRAMYLNTLK